MAKWADFCITRVKYERNRIAVAEVEVRPDLGSSLGAPEYLSRQAVVAAILRRQATFVTAWVENGMYVPGAEVGVVEIHRELFLRTDQNAVKADNLGQLPEYG